MSTWFSGRDLDTTTTKAKRVFFDENDGDTVTHESNGSLESHRNSLTLGRRSQRGSRSEVLVLDDTDEHMPEPVMTRTTVSEKPSLGLADTRAQSMQRNPIKNGKEDELARPDLVAQSIDATVKATGADLSEQEYAHALIREYVQAYYPRNVLEMFDKEKPATRSPDAASIDRIHRRVVGRGDPVDGQTKYEQLLVVWDKAVHRRTLKTRPRSKQAPDESGSSSRTKSKTKSTSSRKKPALTVSTSSDDTTEASIDFNRLNHPGHTPKADSSTLASVIGEPGSTPKASASELKALGFADIDDISTSSDATGKTDEEADDDGDTDSELSNYAMRKRTVKKHNKRVNIGEPGGTPRKEYIFFRETPPQFVTETVEEAERILRTILGDDTFRRRLHPTMSAKAERFVELQSSDVAKYTIGQSVDNLGAQRNICGLVSKLYGSRQCGSSGPGTIVIDTWYGSDTEPTSGAEDDTTPS